MRAAYHVDAHRLELRDDVADPVADDSSPPPISPMILLKAASSSASIASERSWPFSADVSCLFSDMGSTHRYVRLSEFNEIFSLVTVIAHDLFPDPVKISSNTGQT